MRRQPLVRDAAAHIIALGQMHMHIGGCKATVHLDPVYQFGKGLAASPFQDVEITGSITAFRRPIGHTVHRHHRRAVTGLSLIICKQCFGGEIFISAV